MYTRLPFHIGIVLWDFFIFYCERRTLSVWQYVVGKRHTQRYTHTLIHHIKIAISREILLVLISRKYFFRRIWLRNGSKIATEAEYVYLGEEQKEERTGTNRSRSERFIETVWRKCGMCGMTNEEIAKQSNRLAQLESEERKNKKRCSLWRGHTQCNTDCIRLNMFICK